MKYDKELLTLSVGLLLLLAGLLAWEFAEPPLCVQNTLTAAEWAEKELHMNVACGGVCVYAVNQYLEAHNLTPEEFPTCCWSSDENPPMSLSEKIAFVITTLGIVGTFVGGVSLSGALLRSLFKKIRGGRK